MQSCKFVMDCVLLHLRLYNFSGISSNNPNNPNNPATPTVLHLIYRITIFNIRAALTRTIVSTSASLITKIWLTSACTEAKLSLLKVSQAESPAERDKYQVRVKLNFWL